MEDKTKLPNEDSEQEKANERYKTALAVVLAVAGIFLIACGIYFFWMRVEMRRFEMASLESQIAQLQKNKPGQNRQGSNPADGGAPSSEGPQDIFADALPENNGENQVSDYEGWKTYTNLEVGYSLRYPSDWKIEETSGLSELFNEPVKYIFIKSPGGKYFLHWGLKNSDDNFRLSERTGMGVGEDVEDGHISILGNSLQIVKHMADRKATEIFYPSAGVTKLNGGRLEMTATFGAASDRKDLSDIPERNLAQKILESIRLIPRDSSAGCNEPFSNEDVINLNDWTRFDNAKYGYSFLFPKDWDPRERMPEFVFANNLAFQFRAGNQASIDMGHLNINQSEDFKIDCVSGKILRVSVREGRRVMGPDQALIAQFSRNGTPFSVVYLYQDMGASLTSDLIEQFKLILKTIKFS